MLSDKLTGYETLLVFLHVLKQVLISKKKNWKNDTDQMRLLLGDPYHIR